MLFNCLFSMCIPELNATFSLFSTAYQSYAFYALAMFTINQLGGHRLLTREHEMVDGQVTFPHGKGTMQTHQPHKIWAQPPCCCVWGWCWCCMKERTFNTPGVWFLCGGFEDADVMSLRFLIRQFIVLGPLFAMFGIIAKYEGVNERHRGVVAQVAGVGSILTLMGAIYATLVYVAIAEKCTYIVEEARQFAKNIHSSGSWEKDQEKELPAPLANIKPKNIWMALITALPQMAGLITSFVITENELQDNGDCFVAVDHQAFWTNFAGVVINSIGSLAAWKVFSPAEDKYMILEMVSTRMLEADTIPGFFLEKQAALYLDIVEKRKASGVAVDLGKERSMLMWPGEVEDEDLEKIMPASVKDSVLSAHRSGLVPGTETTTDIALQEHTQVGISGEANDAK